MKTMLKTMLLATALGVSGTATAQNIPAAVVAVVNSQRILAECTACKAANTQIGNLVSQARTRQQTLSAPLATEQQAIQTAAQGLQNQTGAARTTAETALNQRLQALQTREAAANQELQRLETNIRSTQANVLRQIEERMNPIIAQVMQQRGANLAVDQRATLASARTVDVTEAVLTALNAALPSVSVTPLPQQAAPAGQQPARPQGR